MNSIVQNHKRGLIWDDRGLSDASVQYVVEAFQDMEDLEVELTISTDEFYRKFVDKKELWDFVILDAIEEDSVNEINPYAGLELAKMVRKNCDEMPIVFLTGDTSGMLRGRYEISPPMVVVAKRLHGWQILEKIVPFVRPRREVFLIHGHQKHCEGMVDRVSESLSEVHVKCSLIESGKARNELGAEIVKLMGNAGAFVALCSPDDKISDNHFQPRGNVLMEMGIVLGLDRGFERLIVLQVWGDGPDQQAVLPTDFGGVLTIRFRPEEDCIPRLLSAIDSRGIGIGTA